MELSTAAAVVVVVVAGPSMQATQLLVWQLITPLWSRSQWVLLIPHTRQLRLLVLLVPLLHLLLLLVLLLLLLHLPLLSREVSWPLVPAALPSPQVQVQEQEQEALRQLLRMLVTLPLG